MARLTLLHPGPTGLVHAESHYAGRRRGKANTRQPTPDQNHLLAFTGATRPFAVDPTQSDRVAAPKYHLARACRSSHGPDFSLLLFSTSFHCEQTT